MDLVPINKLYKRLCTCMGREITVQRSKLFKINLRLVLLVHVNKHNIKKIVARQMITGLVPDA